MANASDSNPFITKREHPNATVDFSPAGSTFRQEAYGDIQTGELVIFVAEPDNKFDSNAIGVYVTSDERTELIGYVPASYNTTITPGEWGGYVTSVRSYTRDGKEYSKVNIRLIDLLGIEEGDME